MSQVRSRERVRDLGEVFTAEREVNAMLDMIATEVVEIESRILEPACGNGNFLVEILRRKLTGVFRLHARRPDFYALLALARVHGIDISAINVEEARKRMVDTLAAEYRTRGVEPGEPLLRAAHSIVERTIVLGNFLKPDTVLVTDYQTPGADRFKLVEYRLSDLKTPFRVDRMVHWTDL